MARTFNIPDKYQSDILSLIKKERNAIDQKKKDKSPTVLSLGSVTLKFARHFGFCFGVENAIEIAYRAVEENPDKRVFLLSEMIHNPHVNRDLEERGVRFLFTTYGEPKVPLSEVTSDDVVIIPAFGTTKEMFQTLQSMNVDIQEYNTTCPFVEKVWKRSAQLGTKNFTILIHGKAKHEETRATFSHASSEGASLVLADVEEAKWLKEFVLGKKGIDEFWMKFEGRTSADFDPERDLSRIGVVNQTTMLASETYEISQILKTAMAEKYGEEKIAEHFADTRDTLCYATSENQEATKQLIASGGDIAIIVGGYNSSNTSHLVELCEDHFPSFFVKGPTELLSEERIRHLDLSTWDVTETEDWIPKKNGTLEVLVTSGASCPDALVQAVIERLLEVLSVPREHYYEQADLYLTSLRENGDKSPDILNIV